MGNSGRNGRCAGELDTIAFNNDEIKPTPPIPTEEKYEDDDEDVCVCDYEQNDNLINYTIYVLIILIISKFFLKTKK